MNFIEPGWFKDFGDGWTLAGRRCRACGRVSFPPKPVCPECFGEEQETIPMSRRGTLHTFTLSCMGPEGIPKPYLIGFVDLPEGIKLFSRLTECDPWEKVLSVGMAMEMVIGTIGRDADGNAIEGYLFRPAGGAAR